MKDERFGKIKEESEGRDKKAKSIGKVCFLNYYRSLNTELDQVRK